jgi:pimeloyl-ACP methyl ester carboxylesterase
MRAKMPSSDGFVERDGVKLYYEIYGQGPETTVFLPPWAIVHSRVYKAQLPYFSERFRCIAYDGRGNGKSDRPADVAAYSLDNYVADALAVMDASNAGKAIVIGLSFGGMLASVLAAHHPERVKAAILVGTVSSIGPANYPHLTTKHFVAQHERFEGWNKFNREHWLANYPDFAEHFIRNIHSEPHSTKQIEDGIGWASDTTGPVLVKTVEARACRPFDVSEAMYRKSAVLCDHSRRQRSIQPYARAKAVADPGAELGPSRRRAQSALAAFPQRQRPDRGLPRSPRYCRPGRRASPDQERQEALYLSSHRSRHGARYRHHTGMRSCTRTWRSNGWRRIP